MINIHDKFDKHTYLIFLCALTSWVGFAPIFGGINSEDFFEVVMISLIIISAFYFFKKSKSKLLAFVLAPLSVVVLWIDFLFITPYIFHEIGRVIILLLFLMITIHLIRIIFISKKVDQELIFASISGYIMIGLMEAILCKLVGFLYPGAYSSLPQESSIMDYAYYAFVTMSTLGYGDVLPLIPESRSLAIFITLIGQFYMTVLIAFLIGKFLSQEKENGH